MNEGDAMADYIPKDEAGKMQWLSNFAAWLNANGTTHGLSSAEVSDFVTIASMAPVAVTNSVTQQAAARAALAAKYTAITTAIEQARRTARRIQDDPHTTDGDRAAAGLTIRDTTPTPTPTDEVMTIPPPMLLLDFSVRRQVSIHWGPNPHNEQQNGRPAGTTGCQIQIARGGIPADEASWMVFDQVTRSPVTHTVHETTPTTYAYRVRYVGKNLKYGPFSTPATCTISV